MISNMLKHSLLQGELADLALYEALRRRARGALAAVLDGFIETEKRHVAFWQSAFATNESALTGRSRFRNGLIRLAVALFGDRAAFLLLEAVETHGIQKYLSLWETTADLSIREGLRTILTEELLHEDEAATQGERAIRPDTIRNAFLGFNDGSVEILGAVNGLYAALGNPSLVALSALTVSCAGALSMAAGAFLATHSEAELERKEAAKRRFLQGVSQEPGTQASPWRAAGLVGSAYLVGAVVPVLPFLLGSTHPWWSIVCSGALILVVSALLAFLSGMSLARRVALNAGVVVASVVVSYGIGRLMEAAFGVPVSG
jgi:VIT1/CCC1 family predicted Fe2+/Mn2+ transporter